MAEKFTFEELPRNGRHVDRDEGCMTSAAVLPDRPRNHLLAYAGFARQKHRHTALGKPADGAENILHCRSMTNQRQIALRRFKRQRF